MKTFRTLFPILGVVAVLAGCSGAESGASTGASQSAISANATAETNGKTHDAFRGRGHHGGPDFLIGAALHENIALTPEQRTTIEGLLGKGEGPKGDRGDRTRMERPQPDKTKIAALAAAVRSGKVDASALQLPKPSGDFEAKMKEHEAKSAANLAKLHDTLTAEQRSALVDAVIAKHAQRTSTAPEGREGQGRKGRAMGEHGPRGGDMGPIGHMLEGLNVTDAQKAQIKAKLEADRPAPPSEADRAAMKTAMDAKLQSFKSDSFDANAFVAPPPNMPKMGNMADHMAKELSAVVSVLDANQREQLAKKIEQGPPARPQ